MSKELLEAINSGDIEKLEELIEDGVDIKQKDEHGMTVLFWAAWYGQIEMFEYLLENQYSQITEKDKYGGTPFFLAAAGGQVEMCRYLIAKKHYQINEKNNQAETAFFLAAYKGKTAVLEYFLTLPGIDLKETNTSTSGHNVLSISGWGGHVKTVAFLLKSGAYIDMFLNDGETAETLIEKHKNKAALPLLQAAGLLMTLATGRPVQRTAEDLLKTLDDNLNARLIETGNTALHLAIIHRQSTLVKLLVEKGADVSIPNNYNRTPLQLMEDAYGSDHYLIALSHISNIDRIATRAEKMSYTENALIQNVEYQHESVEIETKESIEVQLSRKAELASLKKQYEHSLSRINEILEKLKTSEKDIVCYKLGEMLSIPLLPIFNPVCAYQFLLRISQSNVTQFQNAQGIMAELLISKKAILIESGLEEPVLSIPSMSLDSDFEDETHDAINLKAIIKHLMYGVSIHTAVLGKFIAQFTMGAEESVKGIDNVRGSDIESQLALMEVLRTQRKALKATEVELAAQKQETKNLAEEVEKLNSEKSRMQQEIDQLKKSNQRSIETTLTGQRVLQFSGAGAGAQKKLIDEAVVTTAKKRKRRVKSRR